MTKPCACPDQLILILDSAKHNNNEAFIVNTMHYEGGGGGGLNPVWSEIFLLSDGQTGLDCTPLRAGYSKKFPGSVNCLFLSQLLLYFSHLRTDDEENAGAREIPGLECVWSDCTG